MTELNSACSEGAPVKPNCHNVNFLASVVRSLGRYKQYNRMIRMGDAGYISPLLPEWFVEGKGVGYLM